MYVIYLCASFDTKIQDGLFTFWPAAVATRAGHLIAVIFNFLYNEKWFYLHILLDELDWAWELIILICLTQK